MIRWNLVGWFVAAIVFIVGLSVAIGQGELIMRLQKVNAASADCATWLNKAEGWTRDNYPQMSIAYSLLAIASGCSR